MRQSTRRRPTESLQQQRNLRKRKPLLMRANEQYCLDFGQKNIDPIRCATCGMYYAVGEESDEKQHAKFHSEFDEGVRWAFKLERPRKYYDDGARVIEIIKTDQKPILDAVNKLLKMSDNDTSAGGDVMKYISNDNTKFFIYVTPTGHIVGYIAVERIKEAFNLIDFESSRLESEPVKAECGVLNLWVHTAYRRSGIGTKLIDVARANLTDLRESTQNGKHGIIHKSRVAVCDPTEAAIPFFRAFIQDKRPIKVYQQNLLTQTE